MCKFIGKKDVIYDIGSNIGDHTVFFANEFPDSSVFGFEPVTEYYEMSKLNAEELKLSNITFFNIGLGDKKTQMEMSISNMSSTIIPQGKTMDVKTFIDIDTLDNITSIKKIPAPDVLKIDVEGFGQEVMDGGLKIIKKYKPLIILEVHPHFIGNDKAITKITFLMNMGYKIVSKLNEYEYILKHSSNEKNCLTTEEKAKMFLK